jgi:hypothetical protein
MLHESSRIESKPFRSLRAPLGLVDRGICKLSKSRARAMDPGVCEERGAEKTNMGAGVQSGCEIAEAAAF